MADAYLCGERVWVIRRWVTNGVEATARWAVGPPARVVAAHGGTVCYAADHPNGVHFAPAADVFRTEAAADAAAAARNRAVRAGGEG